jgi:YegS/Rv2252/BmrU family lipid kinase
MRAAIINPASASGRTATRWRSIVARLEAAGEPVEVQLTRGPGDAISIVRRLLEDGCSDLVVLGGDGTIGEVVAGCVRPDGSGVARSGIVLSVIHQGTGGDLARGMGIPKDEDGAIAVALGSKTRSIDLGFASFTQDPDVEVVGDRQPDGRMARGFVTTSNVGLGAEVVQKVTGPLKRLGNNGSFAVATVGSLARNRPRPVRITTDEGLDVTLDVVDVDVCNNAWMGGGMHVAPDSELDDGLFDVVMIGAAGRLRLIRTFPKIYSGAHVRDPLVRVERTAGLEVSVPEGAHEQGVVLDGELVGRTPVRYAVLPRAIAVRVAG